MVTKRDGSGTWWKAAGVLLAGGLALAGLLVAATDVRTTARANAVTNDKQDLCIERLAAADAGLQTQISELDKRSTVTQTKLDNIDRGLDEIKALLKSHMERTLTR